MGWIPVAKPWADITHAISTKVFDPWVGLLASFVFLALIMLPVNRFNGVKSKDWFKGFFVIFFSAWIIWLLSNYSPIVKVIGSAEVGYVIALLAGIAITNLLRIPSWLKDSARGELFIKTAIVLLGAKILLTTFVTSAPTILAAAFLSFPVVWIVAFLISKKIGLDKNFSATLSSGVGICGVSASIATAAAIEAPAIYSTVISSIIVIFSAIEIILMPFIAAAFFPTDFDAAGVWMGLSVKTDGAASASASVVDGLIKANGSALNAAVITKVMIDIWIGVISFLLATVWTYKIRKKTNANTSPRVLWYRFPKFVIGYIATSAVLSAIALTHVFSCRGGKSSRTNNIIWNGAVKDCVFYLYVFCHRTWHSILKIQGDQSQKASNCICGFLTHRHSLGRDSFISTICKMIFRNVDKTQIVALFDYILLIYKSQATKLACMSIRTRN